MTIESIHRFADKAGYVVDCIFESVFVGMTIMTALAGHFGLASLFLAFWCATEEGKIPFFCVAFSMILAALSIMQMLGYVHFESTLKLAFDSWGRA